MPSTAASVSNENFREPLFDCNRYVLKRELSPHPSKMVSIHSTFTGLYVESHGVTDTVGYDYVLKKVIKYSPEMYMYRSNVTPIWTLNELEGGNSAISMWSAGEFTFRGVRPTYVEKYDRRVHWKQRIDRMIPTLTRNESQVNLVMFYTSHPDDESHKYAVPSKQVSR